jgi:hypothetical protein
MLNGFTNVVVNKDLTDDIKNSLMDLAKKTICVGIPEEENTVHDGIANAELLYIHTNGIRDVSMRRAMQHDLESMPYSKAHELYVHENGSPLWHAPPRPVLEPAIDNGKEQVAELMKDVAKVALDGGDITPALEEVGLQGQNIARAWFTNPANNWAPNSKITIARKGSDKPLIDSGEMRKAITYVVKDGEF